MTDVQHLPRIDIVDIERISKKWCQLFPRLSNYKHDIPAMNALIYNF